MKANGFVLVMYTEGKGRKRNDVFVISWPCGQEKTKHFRQQEELCTGCKICLTSLYLQCTTQTKFITLKNRFVVFLGLNASFAV